MIRPKYLLNYYVIDSRPSECQLLPLSWIPLESILFNKFNKQTDIWSLGCLIYELFSLGEVAYFGYSSKQVIDAVRSNLMPPKPLLCPNGIYKVMCKCLSDLPTIRPSIKQVYEQLNLYSGQCSSFLDHHLCSLSTNMYEDQLIGLSNDQLLNIKNTRAKYTHALQAISSQSSSASCTNRSGSITKTKSYANIKNFTQPTSNGHEMDFGYDNMNLIITQNGTNCKPEVTRIPLSKSINLCANRLVSFGQTSEKFDDDDKNQYDEPVIESRMRT